MQRVVRACGARVGCMPCKQCFVLCCACGLAGAQCARRMRTRVRRLTCHMRMRLRGVCAKAPGAMSALAAVHGAWPSFGQVPRAGSARGTLERKRATHGCARARRTPTVRDEADGLRSAAAAATRAVEVVAAAAPAAAARAAAAAGATAAGSGAAGGGAGPAALARALPGPCCERGTKEQAQLCVIGLELQVVVPRYKATGNTRPQALPGVRGASGVEMGSPCMPCSASRSTAPAHVRASTSAACVVRRAGRHVGDRAACVRACVSCACPTSLRAPCMHV